MNDDTFFIHQLEHRGIRPTATRLQILRQMMRGDEMVSMPMLEQSLPDVDKSTISRTLSLFLLNGLVHAIDDGSGSVKYNVCEEGCACEELIEDEHTHFSCTRCHRTFCLKQIHVPVVTLPDGFRLQSVNYVLHGLCPACSEREDRKGRTFR